MHRREMLRVSAAIAGCAASGISSEDVLQAATAVFVTDAKPGEDIFAYLKRTVGKFDNDRYCQLLGAANEFKEGDLAIGVSAADDRSRQQARQLLANTQIADIDARPVFEDDLYRFIESHRSQIVAKLSSQTVGQLKEFLMTASEAEIKAHMTSLSSDVIACVVKLMTNDELTIVGAKVFNPLPGSQIGAKGYFGARVQPNSPTDNVDDIRWQVFDAFSYAVGDVLLGTNPVSSTAESVAAVEATLKDILKTFEIDDLLPHCVLSHVDVQAEVENAQPGSTELWFQSIAGCDTANQTFDISIEKMVAYAKKRTGRFGMYFETGQGADFTNGHSHGFDMVLHESRKYGFARGLSKIVQQANGNADRMPWVHLNDVAGFIGPEVFRSREQLVRCCLEDIVMGKLHGLCLGLDICSTLHMDVSLDDLDWCMDRIMPACPAYLMALPTKIDPMLGYLTTGYQDHVRLRNKFELKVNDAMAKFFESLDVVDTNGKPAKNFGKPEQVYLRYCQSRDDERADEEILAEAKRKIEEVRGRGVFIAVGHGETPSDLEPKLAESIKGIYDDAKLSIWAELQPEFVASIPDQQLLETQSIDRNDYILHPTGGEQLSEVAENLVDHLREVHAGKYDTQIVISDGLNALSISEPNQLLPFLKKLRAELAKRNARVANENLVVNSGRVRAGYRIGEKLFGNAKKPCSLVHIIGERPGTGHRTFSVYFTTANGETWAETGKVDHDITKVVSGIAKTALLPDKAAEEVARLLRT